MDDEDGQEEDFPDLKSTPPARTDSISHLKEDQKDVMLLH